MEIYELVNAINSKEDFLYFMQLLRQDYKNNLSDWENNNLDTYLKGISAWIQDMEGYFHNNNVSLPSNIPWNVLACILFGARMYE